MTTTPFAISRFADAPKPIPRVRHDRLYIPLQRSAPPLRSYFIETLRGLGIGALVLILFFGAVIMAGG